MYPGFAWTMLALWIASIPLTVLSSSLTYWEVDSTCLRQRNLWKKKEIPWTEVTRVGRFGFTTDTIKISCGHSVEDYGWLYAEPRNRCEFLDELRRFAPHAEFGL